MAKSTTFEFGEFDAGYLVAWNITTQCQNTCSIKITSGNTELISTGKNTPETKLTMLSQGSALLPVYNVNVTVTVNEATTELKNSKTSGAILDHVGHKVGYVYDVCIEDGTDNDYNDIYINLVGWARKG